MDIRCLRRWTQLTLLLCLWPSIGQTQNKDAKPHYDQAVKHANAKQWDDAHVEFEKAWSKDNHVLIAYAWCMVAVDSKDEAKKQASCPLVDVSKLDKARRIKYHNVYTTTQKAKSPVVIKNDCSENRGTCTVDKSKTTITNNDNRQINAETENVRMTSWGYTGIVMMVVGAASTVWLFRELNVIDDYNAKGRAAQSKAELDALIEPHSNAQWRGRVALLGALVFGIGGTVLFVNDAFSVETRVKSSKSDIEIKLSPAFVQVRWK